MERVTITAARRPSRSRVNPSFSGSLPGFPDVENWVVDDDDEGLPLPDHFPEPCVDSQPEKKQHTPRSSVTLERGAMLVYCPPKPAKKSPQPPVRSPKSVMTSPKPPVTSPKPAPKSMKPPPTSPKPVLTSNQTAPPSPKPSATNAKAAVTTSIQPMVTSCTKPVVVSDSNVRGSGQGEEGVKEGIKRITDKYATPNSLLRNASVSSGDPTSPSSDPQSPSSDPQSPSSDPQSPSDDSQSVTLRRRDTLPSFPAPSITITLSPSFPLSHTVPPPSTTAQTAESVDMSSSITSTSSVSSSRPDSASLLLPATLPSSGSGLCLGSASDSVSDMTSEISETPSSATLRDSVFSNSMSEYSGLLATCRYQSVSGIPLPASLGEGLTEQDVQQVEMFYRSHRSDVTVCRCLANLYLGSASSKHPSLSTPAPQNGSVSSSTYSDLWQFVTIGIPLLVQDSGDHHRSRQMNIVLAEKGTGFVLWKDVVTAHSRYSCPQSNFHTLTLSSDANKLVGLCFDDTKAAAEFGAFITKLTVDFDGDSGTLKKRGKRKRQESKRKMKYKAPRKSDISQPCQFQHITKLERPQITGVMPLPPNSSVLGLSDILRDRLSVSSRTPSYSSDLSEACTLASDH